MPIMDGFKSCKKINKYFKSIENKSYNKCDEQKNWLRDLKNSFLFCSEIVEDD